MKIALRCGCSAFRDFSDLHDFSDFRDLKFSTNVHNYLQGTESNRWRKRAEYTKLSTTSMLTIYRRHEKRCRFWKRAEGRANPDRVHLSGDVFVREGQSKRSCALWVGGMARGHEVRQSLGTRNLETANRLSTRLYSGNLLHCRSALLFCFVRFLVLRT
jgi:hypothetical protein